MADRISVLIEEEKVQSRVNEIARQISRDYKDEEVHLICILKGSLFFTADLAKRIESPVTVDFISVSSYGDGTESSGRIKIIKDLDDNIAGKNVIVVEDIIDSGRTLSFLMEMLKVRGPKSLKLCTFLNKPERRVVDVDVDYIGFDIPDKFVVGYGMDYAQKYRALPYIGVVEL
ncbi:MAG: hypoxanthine phosphoribosyltransferase [Lachnospiraceae bacterium]|nr:hypoxanthine phosphoribosyltransferase [Lachnospiraceae bacterium]